MMQAAFLHGACAIEVERCPARATCPVGSFCGVERGGCGQALYPSVEEVEQGALVWTELRYEQRVHFVQRGVFALIPNFEHDESIVTSLYGAGYGIGLPELYIPRAVAGTYHLRALTPGRLCSFPAKPFRRHLESLPGPASQQIISCALTNIVEASCAQLRTVSRTALSERVALLFARLRNLCAHQGVVLDEVNLTHRDIAELVASDRASVTRALHKLVQDGWIELGYKTIRLTAAFIAYADGCSDVYANFQEPALSHVTPA